MMKAILALEDGTIFEGTQVVGYQEILTDPAYRKQIVVMGYPHIGNYGINDRCKESDQTHAGAMIVKEYSKIYSNWQAKESLGDFMKKNKVIGIEGIDTRALTVHIRDNGEMRCVVSTKDFNKESLVKKAKAYELPDLASEIPTSKSKIQNKSKIPNPKVVIDLGINNSLLAKFPGAAIVNYKTQADKILAMKPEQVVISSGPGDPRKLTGLIEEVKGLIGKVPVYGIQNGACVLALALGCSVNRMKVGHHGVNHPVVDPKSGRGEISVQNHSYGIESVPDNVEVVHVNLNDKTIEKIQSKDGKCVATLYYPIDERGKLNSNLNQKEEVKCQSVLI
jgi:carbamoyl-phosphate synthase small subunit